MLTATRLSSPLSLAGQTLPNRFVMAPMTRFRSPAGIPTPEVAAYYRRRAEGGVGLIITEGVLVGHPSASHETTVPRMTAGAAEAGWRHVADEVHAAGGRIAAQLWHLGGERRPVDGYPAWTPATMGTAEIDTLISAYAEAARVATRAGFDAVEIHAAHGYLLDEFLWPATNRRTDRFGGTPARRAAFPAEVVGAVRAELPASTPLIVRFSQFKERDWTARIAAGPAELDEILSALAAAGADVLHASQRRFWEPAFDGSPLNLAGWAKRLTGLPTITVGSVGLSHALWSQHRDRLVEGLGTEFDLVALGRILLGNPGWVRAFEQDRLGGVRDYRKADEETFF